MCFSALYFHSLRGFGCSRFVLVVSHSRPQSPSFLGHVVGKRGAQPLVGYKLSRVALGTRMGCFCAEEKTSAEPSADSRLGFLLSMRIRYLQDLGGNHMTKPVVEPVLSTCASFLYYFAVQK